MSEQPRNSALADDTPLYKFEIELRGAHKDYGVVFARTPEQAADCAAALNGEPQQTGPNGLRRLHHPRLRGGLHEFTWGERVAEARTRQRNAAAVKREHYGVA